MAVGVNQGLEPPGTPHRPVPFPNRRKGAVVPRSDVNTMPWGRGRRDRCEIVRESSCSLAPCTNTYPSADFEEGVFLPPQPKPPERRQRSNRKGPVDPRSRAGAVLSLPTVTPEPVKGWLAVTKHEWDVLWKLPQAGVVQTSDEPALRRLFALKDDRERAMRAYRKSPVVKGSTGQPIINPLAKMAAQWDGEILQLEDRFGLNPLARIKVGLGLGEVSKTLEELSRAAYGNDEDEDDPAALLLAGPDGRGSTVTVTWGEGGEVDRGERPAGPG